MGEAIIIDGRKLATEVRATIKEKVAKIKSQYHLIPGLAVIMVGNDPASEVYVRNKIKATHEVGMFSFEYKMPAEISEKLLLKKIEHLNHDPKVHGILVQLPLPKHINASEIINSIDPEKDVDGFHPMNAGKLSIGLDGFIPCTPAGCLDLIKTVRKDLTGLKAVVIGRSNIVGKPMAQLLLRENCTVTMVHSKTQNIKDEIKSADIVVAAVGIPEFVKADYIKEGAIVIDIGINRVGDKLIGDVDFANVKNVASAITPVPGGVGPMTIAKLLTNTFNASIKSRNLSVDQLG